MQSERSASAEMQISISVDGALRKLDVEPRMLLVQALREKLKVTGPHIGCESGRCGACTVIVDGHAVKACMMLAVQADGKSVITAASLSDNKLGKVLQNKFHEHHALQCGYCTPGMLSAAVDLLANNARPNEEDVRQALRGNLCRCTGYQHIVDAVLDAATSLNTADSREHGVES